MRHPLAELADVPALDVDPIAQVAHLAPQGAERGRDRREDRDAGAHDSPRGGVHTAILGDAAGGGDIAPAQAGGWGAGPSAAPANEYAARRFGLTPPAGAVELRRDVERSILAASGTSPVLVNLLPART